MNAVDADEPVSPMSPLSPLSGEDVLLGENGVRTYIECDAGAIWIKHHPNEASPRLTVKVHNVVVTDERLQKMLDALHLAFVDCDQLRVRVYALYDVADMQRVGMKQLHYVVNWMSADTPDGNREDVISHVVDVVAIMLRNTIVGRLLRGLVKVMQGIVQPEQPNRICTSVDELDEYLEEVVLPAKVASADKFKARPNVPVQGLNTTMSPVPGYVPRGTLSTAAPFFKRIPTQFLVDSSEPMSLGEKSPSTRISEPSTSTPSDDASLETLFGIGSPHSDGGSSPLKGAGVGFGFSKPVGKEAVMEEEIVQPPVRTSFFSWFSCSCVPPTATAHGVPQ
jgi:hypothetical protein